MSNKSVLFVAVLLGIISISSCKIASPVFKTVQNVKFEKLEMKGLKLEAEAVFHNPNHLKFKMTDIDLNVVLDSMLIGTLGEKTDIKVNKQSDFSVFLAFKIKPEGTILQDLKTLYGIIANKQSELYIVGNIRVNALLFKFTVSVKYRQKIKRSDFE